MVSTGPDRGALAAIRCLTRARWAVEQSPMKLQPNPYSVHHEIKDHENP